MKSVPLCLSLLALILGFSGIVDAVPNAKPFSEPASIMIIGIGFVSVGTFMRRRNKPVHMRTRQGHDHTLRTEVSPNPYEQPQDTCTVEYYKTTGIYSTLAKNDLIRGCSILSENRSSG